MLHGRATAEAAAATAQKTFEQGAIATDLPTVEMPRADLDAGVGVLTAFVRAGLAASNGEMRRHIQGGAVRVNDVAVTDDKAKIGTSDLGPDGVVKLSVGKKRHALLRAV
jgi:tyrosyl-tRNA synthetase